MNRNFPKSLLASAMLAAVSTAYADAGTVPTLDKATIDSIPIVRVAQTLDPERNDLSVLSRSLEVGSSAQCGQERSQSLTITVPVKTDVAAKVKLDARGAIITTDKAHAQCTVQVNEQLVSAWTVGKDSVFLLSATLDVAADATEAVFAVSLGCASSISGAEANAYLDSFDISIGPAVADSADH